MKRGGGGKGYYDVDPVYFYFIGPEGAGEGGGEG